jgi:REP element-mobilizing transposase RayT
MGNQPRYLSPECTLVEVTQRTFQGRFLLKPSRPLNDLIVGALARAADRFPVDVVYPAFLSNHFHLLLRSETQKALSDFMEYFTSKVAREVCRLYGWQGCVFPHPYKVREISGEEAAQVERLRYLMAQGVKEGLVASPLDWPGVHGAEALLNDQPIPGSWHDRTAEYNARRNGRQVNPETFVQRESLKLAPMPCWEHVSPAKRRQLAADLVREVEELGRIERQGRQVLGRREVLAASPHQRPETFEARPVPRFHAIRREVRQRLAEAYRLFLDQYRKASKELRQGDREAVFPGGCFPPGLPWVPAEPSPRPP